MNLIQRYMIPVSLNQTTNHVSLNQMMNRVLLTTKKKYVAYVYVQLNIIVLVLQNVDIFLIMNV